MREHEDDVIRIGDLVEVIDRFLEALNSNLYLGAIVRVSGVKNEPNQKGEVGPWISIEDVHPYTIFGFMTVMANHARCFRKIHPDGFKKGDESLNLIELGVRV